MRLVNLVVVIFSMLLWVGCASAKPTKMTSEKEIAAPDESSAWIYSSSDPRFPHSLYIVGKGYSQKSAEEAKRKAMVDVEKQISVMIKSVDTRQKKEMLHAENSWQWENNAHFSKLRTSGKVEGIEVVREAKQPDGWHALAVLDKMEFVERTVAAIAQLENEIDLSLKNAEEWIQKNDPAAALAQLEGVREKMEQRDLLWVRLSAVDAGQAAEIKRRNIVDLESIGGKIAAAIEVKLVAGQGQEIESGMMLPQPLLFAVSLSGKPVARVPVALLSDDGRRVIETRLSDSEGRIEWQPVGRLAGTAGENKLRFGLRLPVDASWRKLLQERDLFVNYRIKSSMLPLRIHLEGGVALRQDVVDQLKTVGIEEDKNANAQLRIRQEKEEAGRLQGLRNETLNMKLSSYVELLDGRGKVVSSCTTSSKGYGSSEATALRQAVANANWGRVAGMVRDGLGVAQSVARKRLALMPPEGDSRDERLATALGDLLIGQLINGGHFSVVERYRLKDLIAEQELSVAGKTESTVEMGKLVGAEQLLFVSLKRNQGTWVAQARIVDVETGRVLSTAAVSRPTQESLSALAGQLSRQLVK